MKHNVITLAASAAVALMATASAQTMTIGGDLKAVPFASEVETFAEALPAAETETPSILFSYCLDPIGSFATGDANDVENKAAILIPAAQATRFAGAQITSIWVCSGLNINFLDRNDVTDVTVWVSEDIFSGEAPAVSKRGRLTRRARTWHEIKLDKPYTIKPNTNVFIGCTMIRPTREDHVIVYDDTSRELGCSFWLDYYLDGEHHEWEDHSEQWGSVGIRATISGDALPQNDVALSEFSAPRRLSYNVGQKSTFRITNRGANTVENIVITYVIGNDRPVTGRIIFPTPLGYNEATTYDFTIEPHDYGNNLPVELKVVAVNGVPDTDESNNVISSTFVCMRADDGFPAITVEEEGTGTWCGNCPRGLLGMEYMTENYPESFIGIGIHSGDDMQIPHSHNYDRHRQMLGGYPNALFNRNWSWGSNLSTDFKGQPESIMRANQRLQSPVSIQAKAYFANEEKTAINVETTSQFAFSGDDPYGIALVVVENGVGPYSQSNYYYGYSPDYGVFNDQQTPSIIFNHVARYISNYDGDENSVPTWRQARTDCHYNGLIDLYYTSTDKDGNAVRKCILDKMDDFEVIALLINRLSGEIENAARVHCNADLPVKAWTNSTPVVETSEAVVRVLSSGIEIEGSYRSGSIVRLDGTVVKRLAGESSVDLAAGFYIVVVDGKATKVAVGR